MNRLLIAGLTALPLLAGCSLFRTDPVPRSTLSASRARTPPGRRGRAKPGRRAGVHAADGSPRRGRGGARATAGRDPRRRPLAQAETAVGGRIRLERDRRRAPARPRGARSGRQCGPSRAASGRDRALHRRSRDQSRTTRRGRGSAAAASARVGPGRRQRRQPDRPARGPGPARRYLLRDRHRTHDRWRARGGPPPRRSRARQRILRRRRLRPYRQRGAGRQYAAGVRERQRGTRGTGADTRGEGPCLQSGALGRACAGRGPGPGRQRRTRAAYRRPWFGDTRDRLERHRRRASGQPAHRGRDRARPGHGGGASPATARGPAGRRRRSGS